MIAVVEHKRRLANICIFSNIIYKFHYRQEFCLKILLPIYKTTEISFYRAILSLGLTVCPRIKCSGKFLLNAEEVA